MIHKHTPERSLIADVERLYRDEIMRRTAYIIIAFVIGMTVGISAAFGADLEPITNREPIVVKDMKSFSPEHTACYLARMPKWKPIYGSTRHQIPKGSRIRWFQTIICRDFSQSPIREFYLNQEFYK